MRRLLVVTIATIAGLVPGSLPGQVEFGSGFSGGALRPSSGDPISVLAVTPSLRLLDPTYHVSLIGMAAAFPGSSALQPGGRAEIGLRRQLGVFRFDLEGAYTREPNPLARARSAWSGVTRVSARRGAGGIWLGYQARTGNALVPWLAHTDWGRGTTGGFWHGFGNLMVTGTIRGVQLRSDGWVSGRPLTDSLGSPIGGPTDSTFERRYDRYMTGELELGWSPGPLHLTGALGAGFNRIPGSSPLWYRVTGEVRLVPRVSLLLGASRLPPNVDPVAPRGRLLMGIRYGPGGPSLSGSSAAVRPAAVAFQATTLDGNWRRFRVRAPVARSVRLLGDFTDWEPMELMEHDDGWWEVSLPIEPGNYRVNLQLDHERPEVPPGLPGVDDEFQGRVGLLVLE